ncbi:MAG: indolepyruvate oxidoreductase subunit beta [Chloroflexota bacterium]|nr:indolepyruvate oxidoreductase subunit beta [Chloroflexota bacterium]
MDSRILLAGIGGQGVLFAHQVLADCAVAAGLNVTGAETHGMSQRGGSVVSHLKIGDNPAPLIRQGTADWLLAFDAAEAYRNLAFVRRGGTVIVNNARTDFPNGQVSQQLGAFNVALRALDADGIAKKLGRVSAANVALLGFAATCDGFPLSRDALRETLARVVRPQSLESNLQAFDEGVKAGTEKS